MAKLAPLCSCAARATLKRSFLGFRACPECKRKYSLTNGTKWFYAAVAIIVGLSFPALASNPDRSAAGNVMSIVFWVLLPIALLIRSATLPKPDARAR
jgi:hypothetical protein